MEYEHVFLEIFSWLPVKSIYKFSSLSKQLSQIPFDNFFVKNQCEKTRLVGDKDFFIQPNTYSWSWMRPHLNILELQSCIRSSIDGLQVPYSSLGFIARIGRVLASSNGLVCCRNFINDINPLFICNPATQYWLEISHPDGENSENLRIIFECNNVDKITDDFMLMSIMWPSDCHWGSDPLCKIYSPREKIWKDGGSLKVGAGRNICYETALCQNGVVYLLSDNGQYFVEGPFFWPYIVAYDVENCVTKFLKLPENSRRNLHDLDCKLSIFKWGNSENSMQSICFVKLYKNVFSIWVLSDEEKSSWNQVFEMHVEDMGLEGSDLSVAGFTVLNGKVLLFATDSMVYQYDLSSESSGKVKKICGHACGKHVIFHSFSSTLRSCGEGATKLPAC